jgi:DNA polymerase gamma 1
VSKVTNKEPLVPAWYKELLCLGPFSARVLNRTLPLLLKLTFDGHCPRYSSAEKWHLVIDGQVVRPPAPGKSKVLSLLGKSNGLSMLQSGHMTTDHGDLVLSIARGNHSEKVSQRILRLAEDLSRSHSSPPLDDPWLGQLDWTLPRTWVDVPRNTRHSVHDTSDAAKFSPPI